jgi:tetratricopeptide (TPR) repeat protein
LRYQVAMNRKQRRALGRPGPGRDRRRAPNPVADWLAAALAHQRAGRLAEAEQGCRLILSVDPGNAQALHLLGLIEHGRGRSTAAVDHIRAAIARAPRDPAFHHNLGNILRDLDRGSEALACYRQALALAPGSVDTLYNLANLCHELGRPEQALAYFERALRLRPDAIELHNNLGTALQDLGRLDEAVASYRKALALRPDSIEALANLASGLRAQGLLEPAQASYQRALALRPDHLDSLIGLGAVLVERGSVEDGVQRYREALALAPDHPGAHNNLGVALVELGRPQEAIAHYRKALAVSPPRPETSNNLGIALERLGRYGEALACYRQALALKPDYTEAHFNRAHALLLTGKFAEGWQEYEWRFAVAGYDRRFDQPLWAGEPLDGRSILLHAEQGYGDTIQFIRYVTAVAQRGGRVVLEVPRSLVRLAATVTGVAQVVPAGAALPPFDCHCPLLSLPRVFDTSLATIPATVPYLFADPERMAYWGSRLPAARLRVGIAWQGNPRARMDKIRSIPVREFAPLAAVPGVRLVSLQRHDGLDQLGALPPGVRIETFGPEFDSGPDAFLDTAAVMTQLDLVISCDTSIAHLSGALARPTWVLLAQHPDWRWLAGREDCPWYPTARLFRQKIAGDWSVPIAAVAAALAQLAS